MTYVTWKSIWCVKMIFEPLLCSMKLCTYLESRLALYPNRPNLASTWALSTRSTIRCVQNNFWSYGMFGANRAPILHWQHCLQIERNEIPHDPLHLGVQSGASKITSEPMVCSAQTMHLSCVRIGTICKTDRIELPLEPCHLRVPLGVAKMISEHMVRLARIVYLSWIKISTISKQT
jgi:hypothetical protein